MKIRVVIPVWRRQEVTKFCFRQLRKLIAETKHEIEVLCIISESEYGPICEEFGFNWLFALNDQLGKKINAGVKKALTYEFDYLMMLNSDSVISTELLDVFYQPYFERKDEFFGVDKVTFLNSGTGEAKDFTYEFTVLGVAKCIRRDVVVRAFDKLGELYRSDLNKGLDHTMMDNLMKIKVFPKMVKYKGQLVYDIKSEVNIWKWEHFDGKGKPVKSELCFKAESVEAN